MDVVGGQRPAQDLSQVNELFVCLFVSPLVITCFFLRIRFLYYFSDIHYIKRERLNARIELCVYHGCICFSNAFLCTLHTSCWLTQVKSVCLSSSSVTVEVAEIVVKSVILRLNITDF